MRDLRRDVARSATTPEHGPLPGLTLGRPPAPPTGVDSDPRTPYYSRPVCTNPGKAVQGPFRWPRAEKTLFACSAGGRFFADDQPISPTRSAAAEEQDVLARSEVLSSEAGGVHPRVHDHTEEAELGASKSGSRALDERDRGHGLRSWRRAQPAGALDRADSRRSGERLAGCAVPHYPRRSRLCGSRFASAGPFQVRSEAAQVSRSPDGPGSRTRLLPETTCRDEEKSRNERSCRIPGTDR